MSGNQSIDQYWKETVKLIYSLLAIWAVVTFVPAYFAKTLVKSTMLGGWPLSYFLSAIVPLVTYLVLLFVYHKQMSKIDEKYGVQED